MKKAILIVSFGTTYPDTRLEALRDQVSMVLQKNPLLSCTHTFSVFQLTFYLINATLVRVIQEKFNKGERHGHYKTDC